MAIDPPYRLDPFQNIINVSWQSEEEISEFAIFIFVKVLPPYPDGCVEGGWTLDSTYRSDETDYLAAYDARIAELESDGYYDYGYISYRPLYESPVHGLTYFPSLSAAQAAAANSCDEYNQGQMSFIYDWNKVWQFSADTNFKVYVTAPITLEATA